MTILLQTVVGSKLHRLDTPESDTDTKGIYAAPLKDLTNPFANDSKVHESKTEDNTLYELRHFCRLAVKGNPTVLEMLWSNMLITQDGWGVRLRGHRSKFLDGQAIKAAHLGYAKSQVQKLTRDAYDGRRAAKATVAWIRVLVQGMDLLTQRTFWPNLSEKDPDTHEVLRRLKFGEMPVEEGQELARWCEERLLNQEPPADMTPDYEWIADFCHKVYLDSQPRRFDPWRDKIG